MLDTLIKVRVALVRSLEYVVMLIMGALVLDVVWGVLTRFVLRNASSWTEELATFLLIWVSLLGASVAFFRKGHLGVDFFVNKLSEKPRLISEILVYLLVFFFAGVVMLYGGAQLVRITLRTNQMSSALNIKMGYVYTALPISGVFIMLFTLEATVEKVCMLLGKRPDMLQRVPNTDIDNKE
jgi:TRAP-type C4-dicarboxylate transport system permease small subunit